MSPKAAPAITSFNAGEWSPNMAGRVDIDRYSAACRTLENFIPLVQGAAQKRPGTRYAVGPTALPQARLVPFVFNREDAHVILLDSAKASFFRNNAPLVRAEISITGITNANPLVVTAPGHGLTGVLPLIVISGVSGMTELNGRLFHAESVTTNTFRLSDLYDLTVDGTGYGTYTGGGTVSWLYAIDTPFLLNDLPSLQWAGQNDVLYIACPTKPPQKLSRHGPLDWTMEEVVFNQIPFAPENLDETSFVALSTAGSNTLTSNKGIFTAAMVGSYIKLREVIEAFNPEWKANTDLDDAQFKAFQANAASWQPGDRIQLDGRVYECTRRGGGSGGSGFTGAAPPTHESGYASDGLTDWRFVNFGYGYCKITSFTDAYRVAVDVIVECPRSTISEAQSVSNISTSNPAVVTMSAAHNWETGDKVFFRNISGLWSFLSNELKTITRLSSTTFSIPLDGTFLGGGATGSAIRMDVGANVTGTNSRIYPSLFRWSHGAWSEWRGYPRAVAFFEDRLIWAGTDQDPQTAWMSRTGRYEDHAITGEDDGALVVTLGASDPIEWLDEQNSLVFGTGGSEFSSDRTSAAPLSPDTVNTIRRRSYYGSKRDVRPIAVENTLLFAQARGRKLRELVFDNDQGGLVASDLTRLSEHITLGLIKEMVFQSEPSRILWVVLEDGQLIGMTYERDEKVVCWHRHPIGETGARVLSVAVIPHPDGDGDQLWLHVQHNTIGGHQPRYIEYMEKRWNRGMPLSGATFSDCTFTYDGSPTATLSGLWNLRGLAVSVLADGVPVAGLTVSSTGRITLPTPASVVQVGLPYSATIETLQLEAGGANGVAAGKVQRINKAVIRVEQAGGSLQYGPSVSELRQAYAFPDGQLYDGDTPNLLWPAGSERGARVALRHSSPLPCTVLAVFPQLTTSE